MMYEEAAFISHAVKWQVPTFVFTFVLFRWNGMKWVQSTVGRWEGIDQQPLVTSDSARPITLLPLLLSQRTLLSPDSIPQIPERIM